MQTTAKHEISQFIFQDKTFYCLKKCTFNGVSNDSASSDEMKIICIGCRPTSFGRGSHFSINKLKYLI